MSSSQNYVTAEKLRSTSIAMITLASVFFIARFAARWSKASRMQAEDFFMVLAFGFFLSMSISYVVIIPPMYRINDVTAGKTPPYPTILQDSLRMIKVFFANSMLLFFTLWSVKFSLLCLYRRLMTGLPKQMKYWWGIVGFCVVTLIGAVVSVFTSCSTMHAWFSPGECNTHRDAVAQIASLYYAFAVDVVSDLMIMILPLRLIWNLQMPTAQKIGIGGIFALGIIGIVVAIIRVVQIGGKAHSDSTPSSSWLALWAVIETSIAVIIGCLPSFAVIWRTARQSRKGYSNQLYYENRGTQGSSKIRGNAVPLSHISHSGMPPNHSRSIWAGTSSSQEELAKPEKISVTSTVHVHSSEVSEVSEHRSWLATE